MEQIKTDKNNNLIISTIKGALSSVAISLVAILVFAFVIKLTGMSDGLVKPINQVIKIISILVGTIFAVKKSKQKSLVCGIFVGLLYTIIAFVVFSLLNGGFSFSTSLLIDIVFGILIGAICSVIAKSLQR